MPVWFIIRQIVEHFITARATCVFILQAAPGPVCWELYRIVYGVSLLVVKSSGGTANFVFGLRSCAQDGVVPRVSLRVVLRFIVGGQTKAERE